jgi:hypothetical protein
MYYKLIDLIVAIRKQGLKNCIDRLCAGLHGAGRSFSSIGNPLHALLPLLCLDLTLILHVIQHISYIVKCLMTLTLRRGLKRGRGRVVLIVIFRVVFALFEGRQRIVAHLTSTGGVLFDNLDKMSFRILYSG